MALPSPEFEPTDAEARTFAPGKARDRWWQGAVIYEVYPRSFQDGDGDGVGDLAGVRSRLDYLVWLGIDAIWLCPFYRSPMLDGGYDISGFCDVDPLFGTMSDFDLLLDAAHQRGLKVVLDFVPNHTSDQHPWFQQSRSSRNNPKRDWYVWADPGPDRSPPTNWCSNFGGSGWEWDETTGQFYYHAFLKEQPDLNWRNGDVALAMADVLRFWLRRGIDGFRVDAVANLVEDEFLRDNPRHPNHDSGLDEIRLTRAFTSDRPETHCHVRDMRAVVDDAGSAVLIGEAHLPVARLMSYYGDGRPGFHLPFNFLLLHTPWCARSIEAAIDQYRILLPEGASPNWVLGNHDERRVASRIGQAQARVAAMLTLSLPGTAFVYYGDELGLEDVPIEPGQVLDAAASRGSASRDPQRSPMPWDASANAGFSTGKPWLPLVADHATRNAAMMRRDSRSILNLYRRLLGLRRSQPALSGDEFRPMRSRGPTLAYWRGAPEQELLVALNFGPGTESLRLARTGSVLVSTDLGRDGERVGPDLALRPNEGVMIQPD